MHLIEVIQPIMDEQGQNKQTARGRSFLFGGEIRFTINGNIP